MTTDHTPTATTTAVPLELPTRADLRIPLQCDAGRAYHVVAKFFELLNDRGFQPIRVIGDDEEADKTPTYWLAMRSVFDQEMTRLDMRAPDGSVAWVLFIPCNAEDVVSDYNAGVPALQAAWDALDAWMEGKA